MTTILIFAAGVLMGFVVCWVWEHLRKLTQSKLLTTKAVVYEPKSPLLPMKFIATFMDHKKQ